MQAFNGFLAKSGGKDKLTALIQVDMKLSLPTLPLLESKAVPFAAVWNINFRSEQSVTNFMQSILTRSSHGIAVHVHVHLSRRAWQCKEDPGLCCSSKEGLPCVWGEVIVMLLC